MVTWSFSSLWLKSFFITFSSYVWDCKRILRNREYSGTSSIALRSISTMAVLFTVFNVGAIYFYALGAWPLVGFEALVGNVFVFHVDSVSDVKNSFTKFIVRVFYVF